MAWRYLLKIVIFWQKQPKTSQKHPKNDSFLLIFDVFTIKNSSKCFQNVFTGTQDIKKTANISGFKHFGNYSNSMVPGGLLVMSYITRLTPLTSFIIRDITLFNTSYGICAASAVMKSTVFTALNAMA